MSMMPKSPQQRSDLFLSLVFAVLFNFSIVGMQRTLGTPMFGVFMLLMIFFALGLLYIAIKPFLLDFNDRKDEEIEEEIAREKKKEEEGTTLTMSIDVFKGVYKVKGWKQVLFALFVQVVWVSLIGVLIYLTLYIFS